MKVLVTGGAGFIGSNIVELLESKNAKVTVLDDFSHASYKNLLGLKADVVCADIRNESLYKKLPKFDAVIHLAAITETTDKDDTKMMTVNFEGFKNILQFCLKNKTKLVYASSAGVYGNGASPMKETNDVVPHNTYAYSKLMCDVYADKYCGKKGQPLVAGVRYFNVYGPKEYHKGLSASMMFHLYNQMKAGNRPRIFKYGEQKRDFIYVKDVARMTVECLGLKKNTVLNVGTGIARSFNDIIAALNKTMKLDLGTEYIDNPYKGFYQDFTQADITQGKKLKITAEYSLEDGIHDYVTNYLSKAF